MAKYELNGRSGLEEVGSTTTSTGEGQYFWKTSLMVKSDDLRFPPV